MRARIRDTELYFDIEGMGLVPEGDRMVERPVGFLIHGGPGSDHSGFKPAFTPLAARMQLVYFDHRGQGRSATGDPARYTLDENVEDMEALRRHLGLGPIVSIGTSYGGMVAMAHAARYPEAVSHLVLIVTAAHGGFRPRAAEIVAARGTPAQQRMADMLWKGELDTEAKLRDFYDVMGPLYSLKYDAAAASRTRNRGILAPAALNRAFAPGGWMETYDLRPELARITAPTLILAGRHDWICPPEFSEEIHRLLPGSELHIFEDSSHSVRVDAPAAMIGAITGFLDRHGAAAPASSAA
ncbi:Alpha/beta hydrolase [Rhodovastum atsumiense]|uniref:Alpha/beta hydrolase n=1 Tax=Rhodovastum atsumiense TaxID=504468 RepID=A0A5M6IN65_9PROT|nr:alpha/beta hydrolase [Rhodovastum atsumiense]KAA5609706.1 alpha/beta hydrolase [Rhodovastum atsumiense]CAH2604475.1 Alpha/beta hydrolase [Rhodovastum atsumiense]